MRACACLYMCVCFFSPSRDLFTSLCPCPLPNQPTNQPNAFPSRQPLPVQTLISEEKQRGPKSLGLLAKTSAKEEAKAAKKMQKEAAKIVKEAGKKIDPKKAQAKAKKDLNKKQKAAAAWWIKYEKKVIFHSLYSLLFLFCVRLACVVHFFSASRFFIWFGCQFVWRICLAQRKA